MLDETVDGWTRRDRELKRWWGSSVTVEEHAVDWEGTLRPLIDGTRRDY